MHAVPANALGTQFTCFLSTKVQILTSEVRTSMHFGHVWALCKRHNRQNCKYLCM